MQKGGTQVYTGKALEEVPGHTAMPGGPGPPCTAWAAPPILLAILKWTAGGLRVFVHRRRSASRGTAAGPARSATRASVGHGTRRWQAPHAPAARPRMNTPADPHTHIHTQRNPNHQTPRLYTSLSSSLPPFLPTSLSLSLLPSVSLPPCLSQSRESFRGLIYVSGACTKSSGRADAARVNTRGMQAGEGKYRASPIIVASAGDRREWRSRVGRAVGGGSARGGVFGERKGAGLCGLCGGDGAG